MKFVIHIGVHKTGTTLLQRNLEHNHETLRAQSVYALTQEWPGLLERQLDYIRRLQNAKRLPLPENALSRAVRRISRAAAERDARMVLMSEENYLGGTIHRQFKWGAEKAQLYPMATACLQLLTFGIKDEDLRFVLYTRDLGGILRGHYTEGLRALAMPYTFEEMLDRCDLTRFRFTDLIARIRATRPGAEFAIQRFEDIRDGTKPFVQDFFRACTLNPARMPVIDEVVYPGIDVQQADALRALTLERDSVSGRGQYRERLREITARPVDPAQPIEIPERYRAQIAELSAADMEATYGAAA